CRDERRESHSNTSGRPGWRTGGIHEALSSQILQLCSPRRKMRPDDIAMSNRRARVWETAESCGRPPKLTGGLPATLRNVRMVSHDQNSPDHQHLFNAEPPGRPRARPTA